MAGSHSLVRVFCLAAVVAVVAGGTKPTIITKTFSSDDGTIGVASIAGITSRNGKVSSVSGVKFYPRTGEKDFFIPSAKSGEKPPTPFSFSKEENGKYTAGTIDIRPGSVSVSSVARSVPEDGSKTRNAPINNMFFTPLSLNSRSLDPWFANNINFGQSPFRYDALRSDWGYPNFRPFINYWQ